MYGTQVPSSTAITDRVIQALERVAEQATGRDGRPDARCEPHMSTRPGQQAAVERAREDRPTSPARQLMEQSRQQASLRRNSSRATTERSTRM